MDKPSAVQNRCRRCEELEKRVSELERQVSSLMAELEKERRGNKRQAAPFSKGQPSASPKNPGRKKGKRHGPHAHRMVPSRIDERYEAPLPCQCPGCGSKRLRKTGNIVQYQAEIPQQIIFRQFTIHSGKCRDCGKKLRGRHPLQTSNAGGAAASQLGSGIHALLALLNKELGLSHGKSVRLLKLMFPELQLARSTSVRSIMRTAKRVEPAVGQLQADIRGAPEVAPDETGWRVGGRSAWLHAFVSHNTTLYKITPGRDHVPCETVLGSEWNGTLTHDGWSVYDRLANAFHQQCLAHLSRRCEKLIETARGGAVHFPRAVLGLVDRAYALRRSWRGHRISSDDMAVQGLALSCELQKLCERRFRNQANRRLGKHILKHTMSWFWFLIDPSIQSTNHWVERAIRPAVVNRKVWGGNRTWLGAQAQATLMSIIQTAKQRAIEPFHWLQKTLTDTLPAIAIR